MVYGVRASSMLQMGKLMLDGGVAPAEFLKQSGLPPTLLLDRDAWIERRRAFQIGERISEVLGDPCIGLHTIELLRLEQLGSAGEALLAASTLGEALACIRQLVARIATGLTIRLDMEGSRVHCSCAYEGTLGEDPRQFVEGNLLLLAKVVGLAVEHVPIEVRLPHDRRRNQDEPERLFGPALAYRAPRAEVVLDRAALDVPLHRRDSRSPASTPRAPPSAPRDTAGAALRAIRDQIELERPTAVSVADTIGMNVRTMQRHLAAWGLTYETLLDDFRHQRAIDYLTDGEYSITEIAFRLGYSDSAHFTRACRRWTGRAPRQLARAVRRRTASDQAA